MIVMFYTLN